MIAFYLDKKPVQKPLDGVTARQMSQAELRGLPAIAAQMNEARTQLQDDRRALVAAYGDTLRLRTYAIVAVGFERLVWEEV